jgi:hypothetical protein
VLRNRQRENRSSVFHVRQWVLWWLYVGVACGVIAVSNIVFGDLTRSQEHALIFLGIMHWLLGGLVCWAFGGIRIAPPMQPPPDKHFDNAGHEEEWHAASEFLFPGGGHTLLPPSRAQRDREALGVYMLEHQEPKHDH